MTNDYQHINSMHVFCDAVILILHSSRQLLNLCVDCVLFAEHLEQLLPKLKIVVLDVLSDLVFVSRWYLLDHDPDYSFYWYLRRHEVCLHLLY